MSKENHKHEEATVFLFVAGLVLSAAILGHKIINSKSVQASRNFKGPVQLTPEEARRHSIERHNQQAVRNHELAIERNKKEIEDFGGVGKVVEVYPTVVILENMDDERMQLPQKSLLAARGDIYRIEPYEKKKVLGERLDPEVINRPGFRFKSLT